MKYLGKAKVLKLFLISLFLGMVFSCQPQRKEEKKEEFFAAARVKVWKVKKQRISERLSFTGTIQAWKKITITPDIAGKVSNIYVEEGDRVKKGQLLAELDTRSIRLQIEQGEAALAAAEANYKDAKRNMERMERLKEENAVSEQQYEKVKLAFEAAEAQLQQAQAALNLARHNFEVSMMRAPFDGIIASKNAEVGDVINPMMAGFSPTSGVLTLVDFSKVKIEFEVSSKDIVRFKKGQRALLKIESFPEKVFEGRITIVNSAADPVTKKFKVEVVAENPELIIRPNTFGEVTIEVSTRDDALVIPQEAILDNSYVFLVKGNKAEKREVKLGLQNTGMVEVLSGVNEGELVIVEGNYGLKEGVEIEILEEGK